ncbi:BREX-1 system adenine-specific DNA-methyltransferase PglX [Mameliella alba]|uniref:BREX-1 system adenine-specific DNA-methyltransferase PglX n=1 Tax=Mameliella alba TaxID=561184 RepID=UPI0014319936|nr:BREX-1 system adenine-specific DNA-methyltransferase PglX [Mameliella alba]
MDTNALKKFAAAARTLLIDQVTVKLDLVLAEGAPARREHPKAVKDLENAIKKDGRKQVIEQVAYTWFNRFTALRFMDANGYTQVRTVSPADNATRPELLSEAMAGNLPDGAPAEISALLDGRTPSHDPQSEAYRLLLVHACNQWHKPMPFLFEELDDYSELLMPEDLLSQTSILARLREVMTEDACRDVEIIGWLYQFYISEKKDQVFAGLKKNVKITAENIPAATQLFTPHWIVRYLVENSLGRLWLLNRPDSRLAERMDYYIAPEEPETDFLKITRPEEIRICDPAAGSGHMLTYAFDLLYAIYEEEGYDATEIPALILTHNLTGAEIDDRAGALAAFALMMKAAAKLGRRRFLRMEAKPDICVLQNVTFTPAEMQDVAAVVGRDLFSAALRETLLQFEHAKNFGSLIVPKLRDPAETLRVVAARDFGGDLLLKEMQERVVTVLRMAEALSSKYHVVVANPPYMGSGGMNPDLKNFVNANFKAAKGDLMTCFMDRSQAIAKKSGQVAMINLPSWLFLGSFEKFREELLKSSTIRSLVHMGRGIFGADFGCVAFCLTNSFEKDGIGQYIRLFDQQSKVTPAETQLSIFHHKKHAPLSVAQKEFLKLPGFPVGYWFSPSVRAAFGKFDPLSEVADARIGLATGRNEYYIRSWHEVSFDRSCVSAQSREDAKKSGKKWFPYAKGGNYRKWFGNNENFLNWEKDGYELQNTMHPDGKRIWAHNFNLDKIFQESICWTAVTIGDTAFRFHPEGFIFDGAAGLCQARPGLSNQGLMAFLNSHVGIKTINLINPTVNLAPGYLGRVPVPVSEANATHGSVEAAIGLAKSDWDFYETSWDFTTPPLLSPDHQGETLADSYDTLRANWQGMTDEMQRLEEENNRIFIDAYGLQDELSAQVPIEEITLTCNPAYRYGVKGSEEDRETRLRADTMAEFLSYAVGCMFGRYSLDEPGLILANQGERLEDYLARIPEPSFRPDEDNVIPVLDGDWFADDITERFRLFLRVTFGEAHFRENLRYIEDALGKDIRKYFTKDFYASHVQRYKKRPIYWMFSSPKGTFNALIYMHRYRADTVSVLLNDYLREFISKLIAERERLEKLSDDPTATQGQRTKALKEAATVAKQIDELNDWEREVIFPLAQQKIEIDLDDGVKHNYPLFGTALKKITGLS